MIVGTSVECTVCGLQKQPRGRSAPMEMTMCNFECPGYNQEPQIGQLWPGETSENFGYPIRAFGSDVERESA